MHGDPLFIDIAVMLAAAVPLMILGRLVRAPAVLSYIAAGICIGPHALGWIGESGRVDSIAELGVALILFFIGLHVPLARLRALGRTAFVSGPLQMIFAVAAVLAVTLAFGGTVRLGIFYGLLAALASTAVVLPILTARDEMSAPFARRFLGMSLFQDLAVIPLILVVPALATGQQRAGVPLETVLLKVVVAVVGVILLIVVARVVVPRALNSISRMGREAFTTASIVLVVATIALAERIGISPALGAFAAGLIIGDTEFIHEIGGILRPFRDVLSAVFFISIGMLLDPSFVYEHPALVLGSALAVVLLKVVTAYPAVRLSPAMRRTSIRTAFAIAPIGEFSFLLAQEGKKHGVIGDWGEQTFVAVAVLTLAGTPLLIAAGNRLAQKFHDREEPEEGSDAHLNLDRHIIIVGYGLNGKNVASVLVATGIRHMVLDEDPDRVVAARLSGSPAMLADGADEEALQHAGVARAVAVIVAISDADGTRRIVRICRRANAEAHIIVRTRYVAEVERLRHLGADEVIPEEFETSLEIVTRTLRVLCVPQNIVANQLRVLRDEGYKLLRDPAVRATDGRRVSALMAAGTSQTYLVLPDSEAEGRTIREVMADSDTVSVVALLRDGRALSPLPLDEPLQAGDTMLLVGPHVDLTHVVGRLERSAEG